MIAHLFEKTGKLISESTVKRLLKRAGLKWKRIKKTTHKKRDEEKFESARVEIDELSAQHKNGEIELWFFDESGFDLEPSVPYAWQLPETIEVPSSRSRRLSVLGFLTPDNQFESFCFEGSVNTDIVVACFEQFVQLESDKKRIVILDNAPIHTSAQFLNSIEEWEKKDVFIKFLPAYSPQLNLIEILWRFIKYYWLPFSAYFSFEQLIKDVEYILTQIGEEFKINFAALR